MKIQKFSFSHHRENWHIDEVSFDDFNLLVGPSGVGKTRILVALELIFDVANKGGHKLDNIEWEIYFSHLEKNYKWQLKSNSGKPISIFESLRTKKSSIQPCEIILEELVKYNPHSQEILFFRTPSEIRFNGKELPKFTPTESIITMFSEESLISPVSQAFQKLVFNESSQKLISSLPVNQFEMVSSQNIIEWQYQEFKDTWGPVASVEKAFLIQEIEKDTFEEIKNYYLDIFSNLEDIRVGNRKVSNEQYDLFFEIKEVDSEEWIPQDRISSGMFRTLIYIIEVITAPKGSVILIDEFENSLGINCMSEVTDFILDYADGLQFIITSHHPYIINNIPWQDWQIVSRKGSHIKTQKATEISALNTASSLDKFTQLINVLDSEEMAA